MTTPNPKPASGAPKGAASAPILMADDDPDDRLLVGEALDQGRPGIDLRFVADGEELMDYLLRRGRYATPADSPRPCVILLDLNMPKMDGREALRAIKGDDELKRIPVVVLTTSRADLDVRGSYDFGANSYISKPSSFAALVEVMAGLGRYWLQIVELPNGRGA